MVLNPAHWATLGKTLTSLHSFYSLRRFTEYGSNLDVKYTLVRLLMSNDRTRKPSYHVAKQQQAHYIRISIIKWTDLAIFLFRIIMYMYVLTSPPWSQAGNRWTESWSGRSSRTHRCRSRWSLLSSALKGFTTTSSSELSVKSVYETWWRFGQRNVLLPLSSDHVPVRRGLVLSVLRDIHVTPVESNSDHHQPLILTAEIALQNQIKITKIWN